MEGAEIARRADGRETPTLAGGRSSRVAALHAARTAARDRAALGDDDGRGEGLHTAAGRGLSNRTGSLGAGRGWWLGHGPDRTQQRGRAASCAHRA